MVSYSIYKNHSLMVSMVCPICNPYVGDRTSPRKFLIKFPRKDLYFADKNGRGSMNNICLNSEILCAQFDDGLCVYLNITK